MSVTFDTREIDRWIKNQSNRKIAKRTALATIGLQSENELKNQSSKISVSSKLYNSMYNKVEGDIVTIESNADYAKIALETGRKPGKMPPSKALEMWAQRKLGDKKLAFVVARSIKQKGTKKYRVKGPKMISEVMKYIEKELIPKELVKLLDKYTQ